MTYLLKLNNQSYELVVEGKKITLFQHGNPLCTMDQKDLEGDGARCAGHFSNSGLHVTQQGNRYFIKTRGQHILLQLDRHQKRAEETVLDEKEIKSPITGKVVSILVKTGENVKVDQVLLIVEAMKMQYEITALQPKTIRQVLVQEGQSVMADETLINFE